ncbi:MAG TPA: endonuclease MutS2 [Patescibacteria group bacterium]|nr:endonuclease MutS2 [Patescibacteria group bacterium]
MDFSVLNTLEYTKIRELLAERTGSVIAGELARELIPVTDIAAVSARLEETAEACTVLNGVPSVPLGGIRDIRELTRRAELGAILEPHELQLIAGTLYTARRMRSFFADLPVEAPGLSALAESIIVLRNIETIIDNTINEQGKIRDDASSELLKLRREIRISQSRVKEKLDSILRSGEYQKYFQDALVTMRGDRYVIPIKQEYRNHFPGIIHDQSASGATLFIEPMAVVNLNNEIKQLAVAEKNEVNRILQVVSGQIGGVAAAILEDCRILAQLDFAFAKARLALDMDAHQPLINRMGYAHLIQARHPLIPRDVVVATDIFLGKDFDTLLITGPNTGGKTVTLKTLGLLALMTQAGLFVPAEPQSEMPVYRKIFADIGDEQSIEQSLSTFSSHMTHLVRILNQVDEGDLVLLDEIGAGTDPTEGAALAMSILEHLHQNGVKTVATTHYSELKTFAFTRSGIENASVEFNVQTLKPTYRLLIGIPGSSNAFAISKRLGLSDAIIERAGQLTKKEHREFESVLSSLEEEKRSYLERFERLDRLEQDLEIRRRRTQQEEDQLRAKKQTQLDKTREEAAQILRQARRESEVIIEELKSQFSVKNEQERQRSIQESRKRLNTGMERLTGLSGKAGSGGVVLPEVTSNSARPGMTVYVTTLNQKGTILSVQGDEATVQLGILKFNVNLSDCRLAEEGSGVKKAAEKKCYGATVAMVQNAVREVDIRGMTVEEGELILEKFIDDAVLAGLSEVMVIHGKGTGALRKGIKSFLDSYSLVKSTRMGELNEGGAGVTVVRLS